LLLLALSSVQGLRIVRDVLVDTELDRDTGRHLIAETCILVGDSVVLSDELNFYSVDWESFTETYRTPLNSDGTPVMYRATKVLDGPAGLFYSSQYQNPWAPPIAPAVLINGTTLERQSWGDLFDIIQVEWFVGIKSLTRDPRVADRFMSIAYDRSAIIDASGRQMEVSGAWVISDQNSFGLAAWDPSGTFFVVCEAFLLRFYDGDNYRLLDQITTGNPVGEYMYQFQVNWETGFLYAISVQVNVFPMPERQCRLHKFDVRQITYVGFADFPLEACDGVEFAHSYSFVNDDWTRIFFSGGIDVNARTIRQNAILEFNLEDLSFVSRTDVPYDIFYANHIGGTRIVAIATDWEALQYDQHLLEIEL